MSHRPDAHLPAPSERGQTMAEYSVVLAVIVLAVIGAVAGLGTTAATLIANVADLVAG